MPTVESSQAQVSLAFVAESTWGTTPAAPTMLDLRAVSESLDFSRDLLESEEIRSDRQLTGSLLGLHRVTGDISLQVGDYHDAQIEQVVFGSFTAGSFSLAAVTVASKAVTLVDDYNNQFAIGESFWIDEAGGDDGRFTIASVALDGSSRTRIVATEALNASTVAAGSFLKNKVATASTTKNYTTVEKRIHDLHQSLRYTGVMIGGMSMTVNPNSIAKITFNNILGKTMTKDNDSLGGPTDWLVGTAGASSGALTMPVDTGATDPAANDTFMVYPAAALVTDDPVSDIVYTVSSYGGGSVVFTPALDADVTDGMVVRFIRPATAVSTNDPLTSFDGAILVDGEALGIVTEITLEINNNFTPSEVVGSYYINNAFAGRSRISGNLKCYLQNFDLLETFTDETDVTILLQMTDGGTLGDASTATIYTWYLPNVKLLGDKFNKSSDAPVEQDINFLAEYDATTGKTLRITKVPTT